MNMRVFTLLLLFSLTFNTLLHSQSPILLNQEDTLFFIGTNCEIKSNEPQAVTINEIMAETDFTKNTNEHVLLGGSKPKNIWLKFTVDNKKNDQSYLELMFPLIDKAILYTVENNQIVDIQQSGQNMPFEKRALHTNTLTFNLKKSESSVITYYLNINVKWVCNIKPKIGTVKSILKSHHYHDLMQGIFFGVIMVLILYNCFIYLQLKDNVYILYSLYLFCGSAFVIRHEGLTVEFLFSNHPHLNDYSLILPSLTSLFGMLFSIKFLNTKEELPRTHKALKVVLFLYVSSLLLVLLSYFEWSLLAAYFISPFSTVIIVIAAVTIWKRGNPTAKFYLIGWIVLSIGLSIFLLENSGMIHHSIFTEYALHTGISLEAIILSYAIAHRFGMIKKEQENMQVEMIEMFRLSQGLVKRQNRSLEQKVQERTLELQNALKDVNDKEEKLQEYAYQLENSNRELTEFAHIASHDLKAPLRSIMSFAQLFERRNKDKFDDTDREYFNFIKSNATQSARLIEDLLNYSKIDKNLGEPVAVDINKCIFIAEMNMQSLIREKNAQINYQNLPILRGHTSLITQLFQNFINNGIKYNQSEQPIINIDVQRNERNEWVFSVSDNGIGIAAENYDKVFAMFRRLHTQTEYDGTGIGLSFCTRIVETYGGKIWLESEIGKGTTFFFTLPKAKMPRHVFEIAA